MAVLDLLSKTFPPLPGVHQGTGAVSGMAHVVDPKSVDADINSELDILFESFAIQVLSFEIDTKEAPNWFAVSFPKSISSFNTVNVFCHPHPGNAGMKESDYASRAGNWPKLFRYAEMLGKQMSIARTNHITVVPFFTDSTYNTTGLFATQWLDILEQVIVGVRNASQASAAPPPRAGSDGRTPHTLVGEIHRLVMDGPTMKKGSVKPAVRTTSSLLTNVVLSCFSRGRALMTTVRGRAQGIDRFLREGWDFDGVGGSPGVGGRTITYDQHRTRMRQADTFHVPPERWVKYHNAVIANVHGDIPAMLACHAATISRVGK